MPTYQYECSECNYSFEILQSMTDRKLKKCPQCGKRKLDRLLGTGSGIIFKGSGFYETDYKKKNLPRARGQKSTEASKIDSEKPSQPPKTEPCTHCSCRNTN